MIHVSLYWNDRRVDDLTLWLFAVCHAVWLHNCLPNQVTGSSIMEILTGTRSSHRDLLRTHVWGCPVYVLDPKLQDGKKIPNWNRRSCLGQFVGFSKCHSTLVANVCHLDTGHVSPQFHVVFDNHFHTMFSDGLNASHMDAICQLLWDTSRDLYAYAEYGPDGSLIYSPPLLDTVWLDEEGQLDCRQHLTVPFEPSPQLTAPTLSSLPLSHTHDDNDNDNASPAPPAVEPEGDMWADHLVYEDLVYTNHSVLI